MLLIFFWLFFWEIGGQNIPADWHDIEESYLTPLTLQSLASFIHLSPVYLSRKFKDYFAMGPIPVV